MRGKVNGKVLFVLKAQQILFRFVFAAAHCILSCPSNHLNKVEFESQMRFFASNREAVQTNRWLPFVRDNSKDCKPVVESKQQAQGTGITGIDHFIELRFHKKRYFQILLILKYSYMYRKPRESNVP